MLSHPRHDRERFFKYTSATTAIKILQVGAVRYSSPLIFNDPFDVQAGLHFDFAIGSLPDKLFKRIEDLVASSTRPNLSVDDPWGQAVLFMWDRRITQGFPRERLWEACELPLKELKDKIIHFQVKYQHKWKEFLPRLRVFSVCEERDNLLMWSHYGKSHTGVVFEFLVLPDEDNPLCVAEPVVYRSAPPPFFTEQQWLDDILGVRDLDVDDLYFRYARVKSDVWSYEKEWRVWDLLPHRQDSFFSDYRLRPNEVGSVYLGCNMDPKLKESFVTLLSANYPKSRIFQARRGTDQFRLYFDAI
ncbi:MAG: DUF2971 domain-containing protein [candidate division NC10 bacterium]|nr:DUF2971 domain-containing protein [candidate division NC10 bacterium]